MKLTTVLLIATCLQVSAKGYSQKVTLNENNIPLQKVFEAIRKQTGYQFFYADEALAAAKNVSLNTRKWTIGRVLDSCLLNQQLTYTIAENTIIIKRKLNAPGGDVPAPVNIDISGKITDEKGQSLEGATILVKGTNNGVKSGSNGDFLINAKPNSTLIISYVGFQTIELKMGSQANIAIQMKPSIATGEQIVVVGYGTQKKKDLTGAVSSIDSKDLASMPVASIGEAMQGRAAGVQVINSGSPGTDVTFRIRGLNTIYNNSPLIVIDGMPTMSGLNQINTDDVESIQVLKDASSAAIYGSRGANGVVIITTKKGKAGKNNFNINSYYGLQKLASPIHLVNAAQYAQIHNEMMANAGRPLNPKFANPESLGKGTDWIDELTRTAAMINTTVSYSGGNDKTQYNTSAGFIDQDGIINTRNFKRYNVQFNLQTKVTNKLRFGHNFTFSRTENKNQYIDWILSDAMQILPTQPVFRNGTYSGPEGSSEWDGDKWNPIGISNTIYSKKITNRILGSVFGEYEILKGLVFRSNVGIDAVFNNYRLWENKFRWGGSNLSTSGLYQESNNAFSWLWDNTLTYAKTLGAHNINVMVGTSAQSNYDEFMSGGVRSFASDATQQLNNGSTDKRINGTRTEWALNSYMGRANYSYQDKYLLTATLRYDGSSRFASDNRWGLFPSASFAWRLSKESFFRDNTVFDDIKIRAGYGITGNQEVPLYKYSNVFQTINYNYNNTLVPAVVPRVAANPIVKWEEVAQTNIGIDFTILKSRMNISIDGYTKNTNDMLVQGVIPISMGYSDASNDKPLVNAGKMSNKGMELAVESRNIIGAFSWTTQLNLSYNQNKVVKLNDTIPLAGNDIGWGYTLSRSQAGQPYGSFYGFVSDGIFQSQEEVAKHAVQTPGADPFNRTSAGDIRFKDLNGDGIINDQDRRYLGNPIPKWMFSMNNVFTYKGLDLAVFLQGVGGNKIYNASRIWNEGMSFVVNQSTETLKRWTGPNTSTEVPRATFNDPNKNTRVSDRFVEDGTYLRLKTLTLGYTIPKTLTGKARIDNVRFYITGQNLLTFTKYKGFDPEVNANGIDQFAYPVSRTISFGLNVNF